MAKNIIVCCDGTANQITGDISNVFKLFRILKHDRTQRVYYSPGIGTIGNLNPWTRGFQTLKSTFEFMTGSGLLDDIVEAYRFVCETYEDGDQLYFFGFSRGAYTVRALAGFINLVGLMKADHLNVAPYALATYYDISQKTEGLAEAWRIDRMMRGRPVTIRFLGLWDTVTSFLTPTARSFMIPRSSTLAYTATNPIVAVVRHAMAIDERRRMFRVHWWQPGQDHKARFQHVAKPQDVKQVWFAGVHSDIGGGYPEAESGLAKIALNWMINEACEFGVQINKETRDHLVFGMKDAGGRNEYVPPNPKARRHDSMSGLPIWPVLELFPKVRRNGEWQPKGARGIYLPLGELRRLDRFVPRPLIHRSVLEHAAATGYDPDNLRRLNGNFEIEPDRPPAEGEPGPAVSAAEGAMMSGTQPASV